MNDEEINELIARDDREVEIFRDMDIQRLRDQKTNWQLAGNHGPPPQPLLQLEELPECYRNDEFFESIAIDDEVEGRGHRRRNIVSYNDGLSDDAWAMVRDLLVVKSFGARFDGCITGAGGRRRHSGRH